MSHNGTVPIRILAVASAAALAIGLGGPAAANPGPEAEPGPVQGLIVTLKTPVATEAQAESVSSDLPVSNVEVTDTVDLGAGNALVELSEGVSEADAQAMIDDLEADPRVAAVEVNRLRHYDAYPADPPDDTYWTNNSLWGLYGTYGIGIASGKNTMNSVWTAGRGSGAVIAVLDTGSTVHPDLDANYVSGYDFVASGVAYCRTSANQDGDYIDTTTYGPLGWDTNPLDPGDWTNVNTGGCTAENSSWHGTHVAGTVAAVGNNNQGVIGVAPLAKVQPVRVLGVDGGYDSDITAAITWASGGTVASVPSNSTPADVINMSLSGYAPDGCPSSWQTAIDAALARGTVIVASAGNSSASASQYVPANCSGVITVASVTSSGNKSSFSNYGSAVEIAAPGSDIWSTVNTGTTTPVAAGYTSYNGTSMAAPHVSGVAALLMSADSSLAPSDVLSILQSTVAAFPGGSSCTTSLCGAGIVQGRAASGTPVITGLTPTAGPVAGGTSTTISGYNLGTTSGVTFGGAAATISATSRSIAATAPARTAGAATVIVTNPAGSTTATSSFTYHDPPTVSSVTPTTGSTSGGTSLTLTGTNLASATAVTVGGAAATITSTSATSVVATSPAGSAGAATITVTTPGGTANLTGQFSYTGGGGGSGGGGGGSSSSSSSSSAGGGSLQEITEVRPAFGPISGGNLVAIIGYGFTGATSVTIGGKAASFRVVNDATVEVTMPPGSALGSADVAVNLSAARGRAFAPGGYVYQADAPAASAPTTPTTPAPADSAGGAEVVAFAAGSSTLTPAAKARLTRLADRVKGTSTIGTVLAFSDARGSRSSTQVASARARAIRTYLTSLGVSGSLTTQIDPGTTPALRREAIVRLSTDPKASTVSDRIRSLIVRYRPGVSPTVDGQVRGASRVTGGLGTGMTLGPDLGLRMYRVDLAQVVSRAEAERAARQMMRDPGVEFAEPDGIVTASVSAD